MKMVISLILKSIILFYQRIISPLLPPTCRYQTTCSNYALKAINKYGPFKGSILALKRILTCHPWGGHGDDSLI